ncbi:MAG: hypothetical protein R3B13_01785 [Polyangiaceae bacterium]
MSRKYALQTAPCWNGQGCGTFPGSRMMDGAAMFMEARRQLCLIQQFANAPTCIDSPTELIQAIRERS